MRRLLLTLLALLAAAAVLVAPTAVAAPGEDAAPQISPPDIGLTAKSEGAGECYADVGLGKFRYGDWSPIFGISRTEGGQIASDMEITGACVNHRRVSVHIRSFDIWGDANSDVTIDGHTVIRNVSEGETHRAHRNGVRLALTYYDSPPLQAHIYHLSIEPQQTEPVAIRHGWGLKQRCLDVRNGHFAQGTRLQLYECNGTKSQRFTKERGWESASRIRSADDRFCVDRVDLDYLHLWRCHDGENQRFWFGSAWRQPTHFFAVDKRYTQVCLNEVSKELQPTLNCHFDGAEEWSLAAEPPHVSVHCGGPAATATARTGRNCVRPVRPLQRRDGRWLVDWHELGQGWRYRVRWDDRSWSAWRHRTHARVPVAFEPRNQLTIQARRAGTHRTFVIDLRR